MAASNFSKDRNSNRVWDGEFAELLVYNEPLPTSVMRKIEGYLAHKWGVVSNLSPSHRYFEYPPPRSVSSANAKIYWGSTDGGEDPGMWENVIDAGEVFVGLRKLEKGMSVVANPDPDQSGTYPVQKLIDLDLPEDGWRSTWTAWNKKNPELTFNLGGIRELNKIRIYHQPFDRPDELMEIEVWVADEELNFELYGTFPGETGPTEQGRFTDIPMDRLETQAVRLFPKYRGWGHQLGEVEFWVYSDGNFGEKVEGLGRGQTYFYRTFVSNSGGAAWAPTTKEFKAEDRIYYEEGKLIIHTDLGTWEHSEGDERVGTITERFFTDPLGNEYSYKVCTFTFDRVELVGELEIVVKGENSLEIVSNNADLLLGVPIDISGGTGVVNGRGAAGPGGWAGGSNDSKGLGPGGGLPDLNTPGGGGYGGAGSYSTFSSGLPYGDGKITHLIGGSGGGGKIEVSGGGGGGGAIRLISGKEIIVESLIRSAGGAGFSSSAGGSGGAIHLKGEKISIGSSAILDVSGGANGGAGGRILMESNSSITNLGEKNLYVSGGGGDESGTSGTLRLKTPTLQGGLDIVGGILTIDTDSAKVIHDGIEIAAGIIEDHYFRDNQGAVWPYSVSKFTFDRIRLGGNLVVNLIGKNALSLEAEAGNIHIGTNLYANGGNSRDDSPGVGRIGGYDGAGSGTLTGNGPGAPSESSSEGHGAAYGGHASGGAEMYGDSALAHLLGGSSGGSGTEGSGSGGGALSLLASGEIIIDKNVVVSANGGNGGSDSAAGSGGAVRMEAVRIYNYGLIEARAGNGVTNSGNSQTRGSSGGRVALIASGDIMAGDIDVSGEWLSNEGSIFLGGEHLNTVLSVKDQVLTIDTKTGYFSIEGGPHGTGVFSNLQYVDNLGQTWPYTVCSFQFGAIDISGASRVNLRGDKPLILETVAGGNIFIGADFILDGGDADSESGYGGKPILNPWRGRSSDRLPGFGPGGPPTAGNWGIGANYEYGDSRLTDLLPGSSGSSGRLFQGSGAGGGAIAFHADGNITIEDGVFISAKGGDGRADGIYDHGGGGSGGAIRLIGKNIFNNGLLSVEGGNRGAGGGRVVMASDGIIERGVISVADGSFAEISPPTLLLPDKIHLSYRKVNETKFRQSVKTRPQNLRAYWPMDEGSGLVTSDINGGKDGSIVGGVTWDSGLFGKALRFNGTNGFVSTTATGEDLGIDGKKSRTISFWAFVEDGNPRSQPGFYGYGERSCPGENRYWAIRNIKDGGYTQLLSQHWCWDPRVYHDRDLRNRWAHFAHIFNGSQVLLYLDGNLVANWTRGEISTGNTDTFQFGRWRNDTNAYFQGMLDDFRVYDSALAGNEILQIFAKDDLVEEVVDHQFYLLASEDPYRFEIAGLPDGLLLNPNTGEVTGIPLELGSFDLNVSAFNAAGKGTGQTQLIINKTAPLLNAVKARFTTSSSTQMTANVLSDGGDPLSLSLFWGSSDGGTNEVVDPGNNSLWDYRVDLNGTFNRGSVSHLVDGLDMNTTYYYRWMASNSVSPKAWSTALEEGILAFGTLMTWENHTQSIE